MDAIKEVSRRWMPCIERVLKVPIKRKCLINRCNALRESRQHPGTLIDQLILNVLYDLPSCVL